MFVIAVALFLSAFRSHRSFFCVSRKSAVLIQEAPSVARRVPQWSVCYVLWHWGIHGSSGSELVAHLVSKVWKILDFQGALEDFKHYSPLLGDIIVEQQWISKIGFNLQSSVRLCPFWANKPMHIGVNELDPCARAQQVPIMCFLVDLSESVRAKRTAMLEEKGLILWSREYQSISKHIKVHCLWELHLSKEIHHSCRGTRRHCYYPAFLGVIVRSGRGISSRSGWDCRIPLCGRSQNTIGGRKTWLNCNAVLWWVGMLSGCLFLLCQIFRLKLW